MKASQFVCLCAAVALPQLALAANSTAPQGLGIVDAVLDFCAKVDARDSAAFAALKVNLAHGAQASLEGTDEFKNAYGLTSQALTQVSKEDALRACAAGVAPPSTHVSHTDRRGTDKHPVRDDRHH